MVATMDVFGSGDVFSPEAFEEVFDTFDEDKGGTISKDEMVEFMDKLLNG